MQRGSFQETFSAAAETAARTAIGRACRIVFLKWMHILLAEDSCSTLEGRGVYMDLYWGMTTMRRIIIGGTWRYPLENGVDSLPHIPKLSFFLFLKGHKEFWNSCLQRFIWLDPGCTGATSRFQCHQQMCWQHVFLNVKSRWGKICQIQRHRLLQRRTGPGNAWSNGARFGIVRATTTK